MNEHAPLYTLPPTDTELDSLVGLEINADPDDDALPIGTVVDATVHELLDEHVILHVQDQRILVERADARALDGALPEKGATVHVLIDAQEPDGTWRGSIDKARQLARYDELTELAQTPTPIHTTLRVALRNGFSADVNGFRAFLPYRDSGIRANQAFDVLGETVDAQIVGLDPKSLELRLSRKEIAEEEHAKAFEDLAQKLNVMDIVEGTVTATTNFGAFVDIRGVEGLIHISEMSIDRVSANNLPVRVGDTVRVQVISIDDERGRIGLSRKEIQLEEQRQKLAEIPKNALVEGRVDGLTDFGAFIDIGDGLSGLCHISELSWTERPNHPKEFLHVGDTHTFRVLDVDPATTRISLSLRQASANPWNDFVDQTPVGAHLDGRIKEVVERGLVIDVGNDLEGFVRLRDLSWTIHAESPQDVRDFTVGETLTFALLRVDPTRQNILLGLKQVEGDPWDDAGEATTVGHIFDAEVSRITDSAAFFEIVPGLDARMHISEISTERIESVRSVLRLGQVVQVMTIGADRNRRRLDVSIKAIEEKRLREQPHSYSEDASMGTLADAFRQSGWSNDTPDESADDTAVDAPSETTVDAAPESTADTAEEPAATPDAQPADADGTPSDSNA